MNVNHINLTVTDVRAAEDFLSKYFGLQNQRQPGDNPNMGFLFDDNGMVLTLMKSPRGAEVKYPGFFHIGFIQESEARVDELYHRLKDDGFDAPPQRSHGWTFYVEAPGGFMVEVLA
jgi:catechol 2,3-dioxygenase-like lactoylglutathione lyase family enzyme